ncbi:MAG: hypothetical protein ACFHXK_13690 [bacterium]
MTWLIVFLGMVVVVGPIMYLLPNAKDKRLSALRGRARALGMSVQITSIAKLDPSAAERVSAGGRTLQPQTACAGYKLPLGQKLALSGELMLLRLPPAPSVTVNEVLPGLALSTESDAQLWARYNAGGAATRLIENAFQRLPQDTLGIAIEAHNVVCFWQEKAKADGDEVATIRAVLEQLREDLQARFGSI